MPLTLRVITPDRTVWDDQVEEIVLPSATGQLGILTGHAPLLTALEIGVMRIRPGKDWQSLALYGGFAEVENDEVKVLVNGAERGENIDREDAGSRFQQAQERLNQTSSEDRPAKMQAETALKRARARFQAAGGMV